MNTLFLKIIDKENLYESWQKFRNGKRNKEDVRIFERDLEDNLFELYYDLKNKEYRHSNYTAFYITDPKQRHIHKATVRDRIVHHAIYRILYPIIDNSFVHDSYSCRLKRGSHKAVKRLRQYVLKVSKNNTSPCFVLKCDIKKFFDTVDHRILLRILKRKIADKDTLWLLKEIICSFDRSGSDQLSLFDSLSMPHSRERERRGLRPRNTHWQLNQSVIC